MKVKRTVTVDTEAFEVGDVIGFELTGREKVRAKAVKDSPNGMLFVFVDCLAKEYPMFKDIGDMDEKDITYVNSDIRNALNGEILARFPDEIRSRMIAVNDEGDMLRIPSEKEIFGTNIFGKIEEEGIRQWESMKNGRNRIARLGAEDVMEWYWLMNRYQDLIFEHDFVSVDAFGTVNHFSMFFALGVRPAFCLL